VAQHTITRRCGHDETIQIYGPNAHGERKERAEWESGRLCRDCFRVAQPAEQAELAYELGLPEISEGSQRQRAWAEALRATAVKELGERVREPAVREVLLALTDARWWIDQRGREADAVDEAVREAAGPTDRDPAADRERTRQMLDWYEHAVNEPRSTRVMQNPHWRPGRGVKRPDPVYLNGLAARAYTVWDVLARRDPHRVADRDTLREWVAAHTGCTSAAYLSAVLDDVASREERLDIVTGLRAEWGIATKLASLAAELSPQPPSTPPAMPDRCSHGRLYSEDCDQCGD
jgi:hypothetical protein